jgi:MlaD protein
MPLQDLTPQLRTRLNRMERAVGWFIMLATLLLLFGFGYYVYHIAEKKGWFAEKIRYYTYVQSADGLKEDGPVKLMGYTVGRITAIKLMPARGPGSEHNVYVEFLVFNQNTEYTGYIWTRGSLVRFVAPGFIGDRELDITRGGDEGYATVSKIPVKLMSIDELRSQVTSTNLRLGQEIYDGTNLVLRAWSSLATNFDKIEQYEHSNVWILDRGHAAKSEVTMWNDYTHHYEPMTKKSMYGLPPDETPAIGDRLQGMVGQIQAALPAITNRVVNVLSNADNITANLANITENLKPSMTNLALITEAARPTITNLAIITTHLTNSDGSLGQWLIPTNLNQKLDATLVNANGTVTNLNSNLVTLNLTLDNVANITSNLNNQVQANTNIVGNISSIIVHSDEFIQGLKRFWLFKHLFAAHKTKTPPPPARKVEPALSPKQKGESQ